MAESQISFEHEPTQYHYDLVEHLQTYSPDLWKMFQSRKTQKSLSEETTTLLLKNSVRLDKETHERVYRIGQEVLNKLSVNAPLALYQTSDIGQKNAMLFFVPDEIHIVFQGDILEALKEVELQALLAHEISHFKLWSIDNGDYYITDRLLDTNASYENASSPQILTARNYQLYTELYADQGSLYVTEDLDSVISALIKIETGLKKTNPEAFLKQAEELLRKGDIFSEGHSHPEAVIRARALQLIFEQKGNAEKELSFMIEGSLSMENLDVLTQSKLQRVTNEIITWYMSSQWMQTDEQLSHTAFYGLHKKDLSPEISDDLIERISGLGEEFTSYFVYLLLDFAAVPCDMEDIPLVRALYIADELGFRSKLEDAVAKELKYRKNYIAVLWSQKSEIFKKAEETFSKEVSK